MKPDFDTRTPISQSDSPWRSISERPRGPQPPAELGDTRLRNRRVQSDISSGLGMARSVPGPAAAAAFIQERRAHYSIDGERVPGLATR